MRNYIIKRILLSILILFSVTFIIYAVLRCLPASYVETMAMQLGGKVESGAQREFGYAEVREHGHTKLLENLYDFIDDDGHNYLKVWMSHGDKVTQMPEGFKLMCSTPTCPIAGMADEERGFYAVQFHPEVTHTEKGRQILENFVLPKFRFFRLHFSKDLQLFFLLLSTIYFGYPPFARFLS